MISKVIHLILFETICTYKITSKICTANNFMSFDSNFLLTANVNLLYCIYRTVNYYICECQQKYLKQHFKNFYSILHPGGYESHCFYAIQKSPIQEQQVQIVNFSLIPCLENYFCSYNFYVDRIAKRIDFYT